MVKTGVSEFSIPAKELFMCVSAIANKIAGARLEIIPRVKSCFQFSLNNGPRFFIAMENKTILAKTILNVPTWTGEYARSPFLIRIKELPQIKARKIKIIMGKKVLFFILSIIICNYR